MKKHISPVLLMLALALLSCRTLIPATRLAPTATIAATRQVPATATTTAPATATVVVATGPMPGADGLGDENYPQMGNGGYDALHYTLELTVDVANNKISGAATLEAQAKQALSSFN